MTERDYYDDVADMMMGSHVGRYIDRATVIRRLREVYPDVAALRTMIEGMFEQIDKAKAEAAARGEVLGVMYPPGPGESEGTLYIPDPDAPKEH
jgi:hypothetical protein